MWLEIGKVLKLHRTKQQKETKKVQLRDTFKFFFKIQFKSHVNYD